MITGNMTPPTADKAPMTVTTTHARLASTLAHLVADHIEAQRPIDLKTTRSAFTGAARVAHALGYGMTPAHIELTVRDFVTAHPRPAGGAFPDARRAWQARVESELADLLSGLS